MPVQKGRFVVISVRDKDNRLLRLAVEGIEEVIVLTDFIKTKILIWLIQDQYFTAFEVGGQ